MTSLSKADVWADLKYALDELERPLPGVRDLNDSFGLEAEFGKEIFREFSNYPLGAYWRAKSRADAKNAHEAIERGLKAILIDSGCTTKQTRSRGHELHLLLWDVQQHNPKAFEGLERCFDSAIQYLNHNHTRSDLHNANIVDYFQEHGREEIFVVHRYESIEGRNGVIYNGTPFIYHEIIRALLALVFGRTPRDIYSRIEEEASQAVWAESKRDPDWDATAWIGQGFVRPRMEAIENLDNKVLLAAIRRCARKFKGRDFGIWSWADGLRHERITAKKKARAECRGVQ